MHCRSLLSASALCVAWRSTMATASFDFEQDITRERYAPTIVFSDPISRQTTLEGYALSIRALTTVYAATFRLLDIGATGASEVSARWSLQLRARVGGPLAPSAAFTGTSVYAVDPASGLLTSHVDRWDAIDDNRFLSLEALAHVARSFTQARTAACAV